jgi:glycosyltransferase involved in cell wall biosynthesis
VPIEDGIKNMSTILFIHQNFPAQFLHLSTHLAQMGHKVHALSMNQASLPSVHSHRHVLPQQLPPMPALHGLRELQAKMLRGLSALQAMQKLKMEGLQPDLIVAHPGWGEALYASDVWPDAKQLHYLEFFYRGSGQDVDFDPEFKKTALSPIADLVRIRNKNINGLMALDSMDWGLSPTHWQKSTYPNRDQARINVIFDGVDSEYLCPNPQAKFIYSEQKNSPPTMLDQQTFEFEHGQEIVTFVARNLEPYRGYHIFMRALPELLRVRPHAQVVIVGGNEVSYGAAAPNGDSWKDIFLREVAAELDRTRVHFVGRLSRSQLTSLLQVSACHVYLTYPFVLSWSCVEAMSIACPIVGSNTAPVKEFLQHEHNGLLVDFFNPLQLTEAIVQLLANPQKAQGLGQAARQTVIERYDLKRVCLPQQTDLIQQILMS